MKNIFTSLVFTLFTLSLFAQAPQGISYQAVARKTNGEPIANTSVNVQFRILNGGVFGTEVYREQHSSTTNAFGLFTLKIGGGSALSGTFAGINWGNGAKFLEVTVQSSFGTVTGGATEMLSVPFAMYAASGNPGPKGDKGDPGLQGPKGDMGAQGVAATTDIAIFEERYSHGVLPITGAGGTPVTNAFNTRNLNTTLTPSPSVTLSGSGLMTFNPGMYLIKASAPAIRVLNHQLFLRRTSDNTILLLGTSEHMNPTENSANRSFISGIITVSAGQTLVCRLDHYFQNVEGGTGQQSLGIAHTQAGTIWNEIPEIYTQITIQKIK